jgi:hypothetical protein
VPFDPPLRGLSGVQDEGAIVDVEVLVADGMPEFLPEPECCGLHAGLPGLLNDRGRVAVDARKRSSAVDTEASAQERLGGALEECLDRFEVCSHKLSLMVGGLGYGLCCDPYVGELIRSCERALTPSIVLKKTLELGRDLELSIGLTSQTPEPGPVEEQPCTLVFERQQVLEPIIR